MTVNGWLQILLFIGAVAAITRPAGRYMALVFAGERTWLDRVLRPVERGIYKLCRIDVDARDAVDGVRLVAACVQLRVDARLVCPSAPAGLAAVQPAGLRRGVSAFRVQHRLVIHHQYELAGVLRRIHHELSHADGRPRLSELRLRRGRHRAGGRLHPRHRPTRAGHDWQLLGGHDAVAALDSVAGLRRDRPGLRVAGRGAEPQALRRGAAFSREPARRPSRRVRPLRRRPSSSSAPTAAASSMRTARTRSRIRHRPRTSSRCS